MSRNDLPIDIPTHTIEGPYWCGIPFEELVSQFAGLSVQFQNEDHLVILTNSFRVHLFQTYQWYIQGQLKTNVYERVIRFLRGNFQSRNIPPAHEQNSIRIAVHIRRGDLAKPKRHRTPSSQHYAHPVQYYDAILGQLRNLLHDHNLNIHVYTENVNADDVVEYCNNTSDVVLHQGGKNEFAEHFCEMVYSDILVISNSSMSQVAGYLCEGVKIYHPNDQYHSLPEDEFITVHDLAQKSITEKISIKPESRA